MEEEIYNDKWNLKEDYPELEYFILNDLPSFEDFQKEFNYITNNKEYYPIINIILNNNSIIKYLEYLPEMNELCNYMIDYCSYKFTREMAHKKKIFDEIKDKDNLINKFLDIYDELLPFVTDNESPIINEDKNAMYKSLKNEDTYYLANFCVDMGEFNYGMVLALIYKKMIYWQNSFINQIINSKNESHSKYKDLFKNEIMIQDCNKNDLIKAITPEDMMNKYILKNAKIKKYGIIEYNYKLIEEELAIDILPNIKKFVSDDDKCLKYVVYQYEGFRGNKDNIITTFNEKYERKELNEEEIAKIYDWFKNNEGKETKTLIDFWFSLQILIDIILEDNYKGNELILTVVNNNKNNDNLKILTNLFNEDFLRKDNDEKDLFKINSMMPLFDFFELLCWKKIKENLVDDYLKDINDNIKKNVDDFFNSNKGGIINKNNLSTAIRRFVSRYLSGKRTQNEINENNIIINYLCNQELWDQKDIVSNNLFEIDLIRLFDKDKVTVGQAAKLCEYLGDELQLYLDKAKDKKEKKFYKYLKSFGESIKNFWNKGNIKEDNEGLDDENDISRKDSINSNSSNNSNDNNSKRISRDSNLSNEDEDEKEMKNDSFNKSDNEDENRDSYNSNESQRNSIEKSGEDEGGY